MMLPPNVKVQILQRKLDDINQGLYVNEVEKSSLEATKKELQEQMDTEIAQANKVQAVNMPKG